MRATALGAYAMPQQLPALGGAVQDAGLSTLYGVLTEPRSGATILFKPLGQAYRTTGMKNPAFGALGAMPFMPLRAFKPIFD